jgi:hypothetical protein
MRLVISWIRNYPGSDLLGIAVGASSANAQRVMKVCDEWQAAKAAGTTNDLTWPQFLAQRREQQKSMGGGYVGAAPIPAAPAPQRAPAPAETIKSATSATRSTRFWRA